MLLLCGPVAQVVGVHLLTTFFLVAHHSWLVYSNIQLWGNSVNTEDDERLIRRAVLRQAQDDVAARNDKRLLFIIDGGFEDESALPKNPRRTGIFAAHGKRPHDKSWVTKAKAKSYEPWLGYRFQVSSRITVVNGRRILTHRKRWGTRRNFEPFSSRSGGAFIPDPPSQCRGKPPKPTRICTS